jgi:hypothetical protein
MDGWGVSTERQPSYLKSKLPSCTTLFSWSSHTTTVLTSKNAKLRPWKRKSIFLCLQMSPLSLWCHPYPVRGMSRRSELAEELKEEWSLQTLNVQHSLIPISTRQLQWKRWFLTLWQKGQSKGIHKRAFGIWRWTDVGYRVPAPPCLVQPPWHELRAWSLIFPIQ